jgi:hypothetical protein
MTTTKPETASLPALNASGLRCLMLALDDYARRNPDAGLVYPGCDTGASPAGLNE